MKKVFIFALAFVLLLSVFGLFACDKEAVNNTLLQIQEEVSPQGNSGEGSGTGTGETVVYTVNAEEWNNALSFYRKNVYYEFTGNGRTVKVELSEDGGLHLFGDFFAERWVIYRTAENKWQEYYSTGLGMGFTSEAAYIESNNWADDFGFISALVPSLKDRLSEFTFDGTNNRYTAGNILIPMGDTAYPMNVIVKFENKKLVYIKFGAMVGEYGFEGTFTKYGTTTITYPQWIIDNTEPPAGGGSGGNENTNYTVNADEYYEALTLDGKNFTYRYSESGEVAQTLEIYEDYSMHRFTENFDYWAIYRGEDLYQTYGGDSHTPSNYTRVDYMKSCFGDDFGLMQLYIPGLRDMYNQLEFDESNNQYFANDVNTSEGKMNIVVKFEDKKVVYILFEAVEYPDEYMEIFLSNYGTTVIEFPDYIVNA